MPPEILISMRKSVIGKKTLRWGREVRSITWMLRLVALPVAVFLASGAPLWSQGGDAQEPLTTEIADKKAAELKEQSQAELAAEAAQEIANESATPTPNPDGPDVILTETDGTEATDAGSALATDPEALPQPGDTVSGETLIEGAPLETDDLRVEDIIDVDSGFDAALPDDAFIDPNAIIPADLPPPAPVAVLESETERLRNERTLYHQIRVRVDEMPEVAAMKERADREPTYEGQRAALREYYRMLFAKIVEIEPSLEGRCKLLKEAYIRRLAQTRLEPTIPLNPPPTPEPLQ